MRHTKKFIAMTAMLFLTGCATGYHASGINGGYSEKQLADNRMEVTFQANGASTSEQAYNYAMKRAAEVTLSHGHRYFEVEHKSNLNVVEQGGTMADGVYIPLSASMPKTVLTIRFVANKTPKAYDAKKVFASVTTE